MNANVLGIQAPEKQCMDKKCPYHGEIRVTQELLRGRVVRKDVNHSATIMWRRPFYVAKYERYETRRSRIRVHNPPCLDADVGQEVLVAKTKPLSKMKHHVVIQITNVEKELAPSRGLPDEQEQQEHKKKQEKTVKKGKDDEST